MPKGIMGNGGSWSLIGCFSDIEGNSTNKCIYAYSFLVGKHPEPQSINAKLFLPIIPIGIVAYAFTLLWDNLCRNSCIFFNKRCRSFMSRTAITLKFKIRWFSPRRTLLTCKAINRFKVSTSYA